MRKRYQWHVITRTQRAFLEYILLDEMEKQNWYGIVSLKLWRSEGLICIQ
jgi:hypothetical protein